MHKILLIDDDIALGTLLDEYLTDEGFDLETAQNGPDGIRKALSGGYALVVLDVMLPGCNGFEVLQQIRKKSDIPVLMLTARSDEVDRIVGLEIGADDYLAKPFNPRELVARIRAIFRRSNIAADPSRSSSEPAKLVVADIEIEVTRRKVLKAGLPIELTGAEFALLKILLLCAGQVVGREELNRTVLGRAYSPFDRSIDVHVSNLRKKLGPGEDAGERIKSVRNEGYMYTVAVDRADT
jgi:two-component system response regulator CpxR